MSDTPEQQNRSIQQSWGRRLLLANRASIGTFAVFVVMMGAILHRQPGGLFRPPDLLFRPDNPARGHFRRGADGFHRDRGRN